MDRVQDRPDFIEIKGVFTERRGTSLQMKMQPGPDFIEIKGVFTNLQKREKVEKKKN